MNTLGTRLKKVRVHFGYSQDKLSKELGVSQFTLSNYETSKRFPESRFLLKLKGLTNVNLNWLIAGKHPAEGFCPDMLEDEEELDFFDFEADSPKDLSFF